MRFIISFTLLLLELIPSISKHKTEELIIWNLETSQSVQEEVPQLQGASFGERTLTLSPGASAKLPFSFFPQFPSRHHNLGPSVVKSSVLENNVEATDGDGERILDDHSSMYMSRDSVADLASILKIDPMEVGRLQVHNVETLVRVDSSRGIYWTKFHNSAVRSNLFHLPHTIVFERDGYVHSDMINVEGERAEYRKAVQKESVAYEYDIYIDNPSEETYMSILDVYPSKPEYVEVLYHHDSGKRSEQQEEGHYRFNNCGYSPMEVLHCNGPVSMEFAGPSVLAPGEKRVYIGTIQLKKELVSDGGSLEDIDEMFLGYLYIQIEHRSTLLLAIALDYMSDGATIFDNQSLGGGGHDNVVNEEAVGDSVSDEAELLDAIPWGEARDDSSSDVGTGIRILEGRLDECDVNIINGPIKISQGPQEYATEQRQFVVQLPHLRKKLSPRQSSLDFGLMTGDEAERSLYLTVKNTGGTPIRLMHQSILFKKLNEHKIGTTSPVMEDYNFSKMISPNETLQDAVKISLKSDLLTGYCDDKCHLSGTVILRFGPSWMSYHEWMYAIMDDPMTWERFSMELPFMIRIMHGYLEYDGSRTFFPAHVDHNSLQVLKCQRSFHRNISLRNMFSVPITLTRLKVQGLDQESDHLSSQFCDDHFTIVGVRTPGKSSTLFPIVSLPGETWGDIGLVYKFPEVDHDELFSMKDPKKCSLTMFTDEAGIFHVPLWIYKSQVKPHVEEAATPIECQRDKADSSVVTGMNCLHALRKAKHFESIVNLMTGESGDRRDEEEAKGILSKVLWMSEMERYFLSLSNDTSSEVTSVDPIVLSFGPIAAGTSKSHNIFISNRNPLPINITIEVPACEGMEIILNDVAKKDANYAMHTLSIENRDFATESLEAMGPKDRAFRTLTKFYDISPATILDSILNKLFETESSGWRPNLPFQRKRTILPAQSPPEFSNDTLRAAFQSKYLGPLLVTLDDDMAYKLNNIEGNSESVLSLVVPPGGVAVFDVVIRAPSTSALLKRNYVDVLSSGILFKTNLGQLIPVVSTYRALFGHFLIDPPQELHAGGNVTLLRVPFTLGHESQMVDTSKKSNDYPMKLRIVHNFSTAVLVKEILSCNHFFRFDTPSGVLPRFMKAGETFVVSVSANIDCSGQRFHTDGSYPSFYQCALKLFEEGTSAGKNRCRSNVYELESGSNEHDPQTHSEDAVKMRVIDALKRAIDFMDMKYAARVKDGSKKVINRMKSNNEMKHPTDHIGPIVIDQVQKEWTQLAKFGMNTILGPIEAQFEFLDSESKETSTMISAVPSTILESTLTIPRLSRMINKFETTPVGEISPLYVPVKNPTAFPVKLRIIGDRNSQFYVHSARQKDAWWTGGAYYLLDDSQCVILQSKQNVTVNSIGGSSFGLYSPSLHSTVALLQNCSGRYCGFNVSQEEKNKSMKRGEFPTKIYPIGSSSAVGFCLAGSLCDEGRNTMKHPTNNTVKDSNPFAFSEGDMDEITLPPYGIGQLGPFYFRPRSKGVFSGFLLMENSLNGYEALSFKGVGSGVNIAFFDGQNLGRIELRNGKSALVLKGGRLTNKSGKSTTAVFIGNMGSFDVEVLSMYLSSPSVSERDKEDGQKMCHLLGFALSECRCQYGQREECGSQSFILKSAKSKVFHIHHQNDCDFRIKHVNLIVEYKNGNVASPMKRAELTVVYEMDNADVSTCSAVSKSLISAFEWHGSKTKAMGSKIFLNSCSILLSIIIFVALLCDMISSAMQKYAAMAKFRASIKSFQRKHKSKRTGYKNWFSAYRCLACADPTSFELTQLGREQTRQMLLNTYRNESMIQPHCILPNGTFARQRKRASGTDDVGTPQQQTNSVSISMNEIVFLHCIFFKKIEIADTVPILPCGLNWRVASSLRNIRNKFTFTNPTLGSLKQGSTKQRNKVSEEENPSSHSSALHIPETYTPISDESCIQAMPFVDYGKEDNVALHLTESVEGKVDENTVEIHSKNTPKDFVSAVLCDENKAVYGSSDESTERDNFEATVSTEATVHTSAHSPIRQSKSVPQETEYTVKSQMNTNTETNVENKTTLFPDSCDNMPNCRNSKIELEQGSTTFNCVESSANSVSNVSNTTLDSDESRTKQKPESSELVTDTSHIETQCSVVDENCDQTCTFNKKEVDNKLPDNKTKMLSPGRRSRNRGRKRRKSKKFQQELEPDNVEGPPQCIAEVGERHDGNKKGGSPSSGHISFKKNNVSSTNDDVRRDIAVSIRPPPGLSPPPGFGESDEVLGFTDNDQIGSVAGAISDINQELNAISNATLLARVLDDNNADSLNLLNASDPDLRESNLSSTSLDETSQIANVMSFFNFLDDSYDHTDGSRNINEDNDDQRLMSKQETSHEAMPLYGNLNPEFNTNLWSDSSHDTHRPIPFGFNVENQQETWKGDGDLSFKPLLTPNVILGQTADDDGDQGNGEKSFDPDAFFAGLLE